MNKKESCRQVIPNPRLNMTKCDERSLLNTDEHEATMSCFKMGFRIKSFVRRAGKTLTAYQASLLNDLLPQITPDKIDFSKYNKFYLEIGFGNGERLAEDSARNKDICFIGCEPFRNGVAQLLTKIKDRAIDNVYIWDNDINILLETIPKNLFDRIYILFPDPWPKLRHNKRRLIQKDFVEKLAQYMTKNAQLVIATDHFDYQQWIEKELSLSQDLELMLKTNSFPKNWIKTKYQKKAESVKIIPKYYEYKLK
jgi:tRNA (guanine-N7-)-methyltransferase